MHVYQCAWPWVQNGSHICHWTGLAGGKIQLIVISILVVLERVHEVIKFHSPGCAAKGSHRHRFRSLQNRFQNLRDSFLTQPNCKRLSVKLIHGQHPQGFDFVHNKPGMERGAKLHLSFPVGMLCRIAKWSSGLCSKIFGSLSLSFPRGT